VDFDRFKAIGDRQSQNGGLFLTRRLKNKTFVAAAVQASRIQNDLNNEPLAWPRGHRPRSFRANAWGRSFQTALGHDFLEGRKFEAAIFSHLTCLKTGEETLTSNFGQKRKSIAAKSIKTSVGLRLLGLINPNENLFLTAAWDRESRKTTTGRARPDPLTGVLSPKGPSFGLETGFRGRLFPTRPALMAFSFGLKGTKRL
jgi:hypothetical protein